MSVEEMLNWTNDVPVGTKQIFEDVLVGKNIKHILEVGCFHGVSLRGFMDLCPNATAVAVDIWDSNVVSELSNIDFDIIEKKFDNNIYKYKNKISKRKGDSKKILRELVSEGEKFDLIYIDGSHTCLDTYHDSVYAWMLLQSGGIMIFDDYLWCVHEKDVDVLNIPFYAIKHFLKTYAGEYKLLSIGYRVFIEKL